MHFECLPASCGENVWVLWVSENSLIFYPQISQIAADSQEGKSVDRRHYRGLLTRFEKWLYRA